jgi:hypothetical protein
MANAPNPPKSNVQILKEAGLIQTKIPAKQAQIIETFSKAEIQTLIKVYGSFSQFKHSHTTGIAF